MISFAGSGILLDIEGTTSSVSFVYDVMFPLVREQLSGYLDANWQKPETQEACDLIAGDAGHRSLTDWCPDINQQPRTVEREVIRLMDGDVKATGLKRLQGLIWKSAFESGKLQAHLYDDVAKSIESWNNAGRDVRIYSSGSVQAQKLFFGHTIEGNLLSLLRGHYDTTTGPKREAESYLKIAGDFDVEAQQLLFLSDVTAELDAAKQAGFQTALCKRPGNAEVSPDHGHDEITSFDDVRLD